MWPESSSVKAVNLVKNLQLSQISDIIYDRFLGVLYMTQDLCFVHF